ncbi:TIGR00266 family protein [Hahella ganghwensis]|uniref:TIGR00266 family protein n=1 Tax=Hahella ganghwensis TaxID=286420 RepID=UPI000368CFDA|nr:TIGR00266 family protein [Hahella ganghwensis]
MNTSAYQVRVTGELNPGVSRESAVEAFSKLFKVANEKAENIFSKAPVVVKKGVDEATANKIQRALDNIGVQSAVEMATAEQVPQAQAQNEQKSEQSTNGSTLERAIERASNAPLKQEVHATSRLVEEQPGYQFKIEGQPDYAFLTVNIPAEKTLRVEASAMATMDTNLVMKTKAKGGLGRLLTSESIFINEFTSQNGPGEIGIAPASPGDLAHVYLRDETIFLQNSAFVASDMNVVVETKWQGLTKGFFSGESLFLIRCSGNGDLWFNTYGGMIMLDVDGDYVVDTSNIVAFTEGLDYKITKVGGYKSLFFSGEGFVCRFSGKGKVWIQTRSVQAFASWMYPYRPVKKKG